MKQFIKENYKQIIFLIIMALIVSVKLPYYVEAPGGTINITKRINKDYDKKNGSLNMLYVTEYKGNIVTVLLSKIIKTWDLYEISNQQVSSENADEIYARNKIMLDNSIDNATLVAYKAAGKEVKITDSKNIVIATTKDNGIKIEDELLTINDIEITNIKTIKDYLEKASPGDNITLKIKRNNKEKTINITLDDDKLLGVMVVTNYTYSLDPELDIKFKSGEGGSSGGMILALGIYSELTNIDILKGRRISGTGTIDAEGNIGEIDGIKYKIAGAVKDKMDVVLVSPYNYEEAKKVIKDNNYKIELVEVKTFDEAIAYLTK